MHRPASSFLFLAALNTFAYGQTNQQAQPVSIAFSNSDSIGPDGPWWYISQAVDSPDQFMTLLPSLSNNTLIVNASACSSQSADCPLPVPALWSLSLADQSSGQSRTWSANHPPSQWDSRYSALLRMGGEGQFSSQRITLHPDGDVNDSQIIDYHVVAVSDSWSSTYPGGAQYTLDAGFLSLYGAEDTFSWPDVNGFVWNNNRTLPAAYANGFIPSVSYGLHVGSVYPNVTGSLVLGGYDSSRALSDPITSNTQTFTLTSISLNVSDGGSSAYLNGGTLPMQGMLRANGSGVTGLAAFPDPGVPYLYLPQDTCDSIAAHLPVTYNKDFNLYFWNTSDKAYEKIVSSPHYIAFELAGNGGPSSTTINVPFALLNLTLESPLTSSSMPYFPCSPWTPTDAPYTLGRSFLQAAFLAQNWNSSTLFLAQAPGPGFQPQNMKTIAVGDTTLAPAKNPPTWDSTWSGTLQALPSNGTHPGRHGKGTKSKTSSSLSAGAIAGIVIGVLAIIAFIAALVFCCVRRKRKGRKGQSVPNQEEMHPFNSNTGTPPHYHNSPYQDAPNFKAEKPLFSPLVEAPGHEPQEMDAHVPVHELPGQHTFKK